MTILSEFFSTPQDLDTFLLELPEGSLVKVVDGKLHIIEKARIVVYNNRMYEIGTGKTIRIMLPLIPPVIKKPNRKRH